MDCADPDCAGKIGGACDTGQVDPCAAGTLQCQNGAAVCVPGSQQTAESIAAGNCDDGLDNDCDGLIDAEDPGCQAGDAGLLNLQVPKRLFLRRGDAVYEIGDDETYDGTKVNVVVEATGTEQTATVALTASPAAGVMVQIDPASITKEVAADGDGITRFIFETTIVGTMKGRWAVNWTATITSPQDGNPANDVLTGTTQVIVIKPLREELRDRYAKIKRR